MVSIRLLVIASYKALSQRLCQTRTRQDHINCIVFEVSVHLRPPQQSISCVLNEHERAGTWMLTASTQAPVQVQGDCDSVVWTLHRQQARRFVEFVSYAHVLYTGTTCKSSWTSQLTEHHRLFLEQTHVVGFEHQQDLDHALCLLSGDHLNVLIQPSQLNRARLFSMW